jgi:hypothetical protein
MKPMLMGAMVGAGMGLATGKDPLKSAVIGGVTAGAGDKIMGGLEGFGFGADELAADAVTSNMGAMNPISDGVMGAMNPETISMFTPDGTSMLGTNNSGLFGLGDAMSNQSMNPSLTQNLGAEAVANLNVPNTGLFSNNIFQQGTDAITNEFDDLELTGGDKLGLGLQASNMIMQPPPEESLLPPPQVIPGKEPSFRKGPMAIDVQQPNTVIRKKYGF